MHVIKTGLPYNSKRKKWPETALYTYRVGEHELAIFMSHPSDEEIASVAEQAGKLALFVAQPIIFMLYEFGTGLPWSDAPFTVHLVPPHERKAPPEDEDQATMRVLLVNADTGIIEAMRLVLLASGFTATLYDAIREQTAMPWDSVAYDAELATTYASIESNDMAGMASNVTDVPAKGDRVNA